MFSILRTLWNIKRSKRAISHLLRIVYDLLTIVIYNTHMQTYSFYVFVCYMKSLNIIHTRNTFIDRLSLASSFFLLSSNLFTFFCLLKNSFILKSCLFLYHHFHDFMLMLLWNNFFCKIHKRMEIKVKGKIVSHAK